MNHESTSPGSSGGGQYEFTVADNGVFAALAGKMRFVGIVLAVIGVLYLLLGGLVILGAVTGQDVAVPQPGGGATRQSLHFGHSIGYLVGGILYLCMGMWTGNGAAAFRRIVDTQGSDIGHLMEAVANLRKLYTLQFWLILIGIIVMILTLGAVILFAMR